MSGNYIDRCMACGRPLDRGGRMRVDLMAERLREGSSSFRMQGTWTVCPTCHGAVLELLRRLREVGA